MTCIASASNETPARTLIDAQGRRIDHLRLSLTDGCNLACSYCSAPELREPCRMAAAFAVAVVRWLTGRYAVRHVRLTGGEPLLHPELLSIVSELSALGTLDEITLTTNAQLLADKAQRLRQAGVTRVNVSLDTLNAERFARLTRGGILGRTLHGIEAAVGAQLTPVRLNVVVQRGFNEDELCELAEWGLVRGCEVRFLELMPIGPLVSGLSGQLVPAAEMLKRLCRRFTLETLPVSPGRPATDYAATSSEQSGPAGIIGVIASTTRPFCASCRRLRITARGEILPCLFDTPGTSLATAWDGSILDERAADRILRNAVAAKSTRGERVQNVPLRAIGG